MKSFYNKFSFLYNYHLDKLGIERSMFLLGMLFLFIALWFYLNQDDNKLLYLLLSIVFFFLSFLFSIPLFLLFIKTFYPKVKNNDFIDYNDVQKNIQVVDGDDVTVKELKNKISEISEELNIDTSKSYAYLLYSLKEKKYDSKSDTWFLNQFLSDSKNKFTPSFFSSIKPEVERLKDFNSKLGKTDKKYLELYNKIQDKFITHNI